MTIEEIKKNYSEYNDEEKMALAYLNTTGKNYIFEVDDGFVKATKFIKDGLIKVRKHPRFSYITKHSHNYLEISYVLSGSVTQILDDKKLTLNEGEILLISTSSKHELIPCGENDIMINFMILPEFFDFLYNMIDDGTIKKFIMNLLSNNNKNNSILFHVGNDICIQNILQNILVCFNKNDILSISLVKQYFLVLLLELIKRPTVTEETISSNYDSILSFKIKSYVDNNYPNGSLSELAKILKEDYFYLSKKIKILTGYTFQELVENKRIEASINLLTNTEATIEDISFHVGYNNLTFFYKLFKKHTGITPNKYRKLNKKVN